MNEIKSDNASHETQTLREKLEAEIAPVPWVDLQIPFARGITLYVDPTLNLVDVAEAIAVNDTVQVESWINESKISNVNDEQAKKWFENGADLLAAIVKPWVLIQSMD